MTTTGEMRRHYNEMMANVTASQSLTTSQKAFINHLLSEQLETECVIFDALNGNPVEAPCVR